MSRSGRSRSCDLRDLPSTSLGPSLQKQVQFTALGHYVAQVADRTRGQFDLATAREQSTLGYLFGQGFHMQLVSFSVSNRASNVTMLSVLRAISCRVISRRLCR